MNESEPVRADSAAPIGRRIGRGHGGPSATASGCGRGTEARGPSLGRTAAARLLSLLLLLSAVACVRPDASRRAEFPEGWSLHEQVEPVTARHGMVVSADSAATAAGLAVLRDGGNAVDAAVALQFALAVVHPRAGNIGGGGFLVLRSPDGTATTVDFREEAPGAATADMYVDEEGKVTSASWTGHLASGVPGAVAGMALAHRRYGSLPWKRLLRPAVRLAEEGFRVDSSLHRVIRGEADRLREFPASSAVFLPDGEAPEVGSVLRQPDLARTLRAIADSGAAVFYRGWIADSLAAEMRRGGGLIDREDLAAYRAVEREPVRFRYRRHTVVSMPPPSSGGVTMAEILHVLEGFDLAAMGRGSADAVHVMVEAMRRAYADRNYYLGDPDFVQMPVERLTSEAYADSLRATIHVDTASPSEQFTKVPMTTGEESRETTHFSVVDSSGTAVAVTTTLNGFFGSAVTVRGAGFFLNNEMDDFTARPGVPNAYGLVQGRANAIRPGKRMLSSMSPTIVVDSTGRTEMVTGTPGGATIITTVTQLILDHVDFGLPAGLSVSAPRVHHQHLPERARYEPDGLSGKVLRELRARGHRMVEREGFSGRVQHIRVTRRGRLIGVTDPRGTGRALGH